MDALTKGLEIVLCLPVWLSGMVEPRWKKRLHT